MLVGGGGGIAIIVTSSRLQVTLRVETCVELELSLSESDLEPSLLISSVSCPDEPGWLQVEDSCYMVSSERMSWFASQHVSRMCPRHNVSGHYFN